MTTHLYDPLTSRAPAAVATGPPGARRIDLFFALPDVGLMGVPNLWHRWWAEGTGWRPIRGWRQRGGFWTSAVSATAYSGGRVDVFGLGLNGELWHTWGIGNALNGADEWPRESLGKPTDEETLFTSPAAVALGPTHLLAGVRTIDRTRPPGRRIIRLRFVDSSGPADNRWRWRSRIIARWPTTWRSGTALGMASRKPGALDLFIVSRRSELLHTWADGETTSPWGGFGQEGPEGGLTSTPSVAVWQDPAASSLHVVSCYGPFPAGPSTDPGRVELKSWLGRHWTSQRPIYTDYATDGRRILSPPVVTSWGKPRLDVFFMSASRTDAGLTHGISENGRDWDWNELLPLPGTL